MNENDLIAEYVKERYPEILNTCDFAVFKFKKSIIAATKEIEKPLLKILDDIRNIDFSEAEAAIKKMLEDKQ